MTFTLEQAATLHTLMRDHHATEAMVVERALRHQIWLYDTDDQLIALGVVDDLGGVRCFEWMGAIS